MLPPNYVSPLGCLQGGGDRTSLQVPLILSAEVAEVQPTNWPFRENHSSSESRPPVHGVHGNLVAAHDTRELEAARARSSFPR